MYIKAQIQWTSKVCEIYLLNYVKSIFQKLSFLEIVVAVILFTSKWQKIFDEKNWTTRLNFPTLINFELTFIIRKKHFLQDFCENQPRISNVQELILFYIELV